MNIAMNPFKATPKPPGPAFAKMVSELETEQMPSSEVTREIIQAKLASSSGSDAKEPRTRALLNRLFPM